jgi:hypothetical protein
VIKEKELKLENEVQTMREENERGSYSYQTALEEKRIQ